MQTELFGEVKRTLGQLSKTTGAMRSKAVREWYEEEKSKGGNIESLELACALWTYEILPQYKFKPLPIKPQAVIEHEEIPVDDRQELAVSYYKIRPEVNRYYELLRKVRIQNREHFEWLASCATLLQKEGKLDEARAIKSHIEGVSKDMLWYAGGS